MTGQDELALAIPDADPRSRAFLKNIKDQIQLLIE